MLALYRQFSQGILVAACCSMSCMTLGYMLNDSYKIEKRQIQNGYENQIRILNDEIKKLKIERKQLN